MISYTEKYQARNLPVSYSFNALTLYLWWLQVMIGHLGCLQKDRLREKVFQTKMEEGFRQFTSSICSYIKKKVYQSYPIKNILFLAPMELAIIEFLHLDTCTSRHQYLLVISGNIEILLRPNQRERKKPKQLQKSCIYVISSYALDHRQHPTWLAKGIFQIF